MPLLSALGLRGRLLFLAILPAAAILAGVLGLNFLRMRSLLLDFGQEILRDRVRAIAADIDRETSEAVTAARVMAIAAENGMLDDRLQALRFTRDVLDCGGSGARPPAETEAARTLASTTAGVAAASTTRAAAASRPSASGS